LSGSWTSGLQWVSRNSIVFWVAHMPMLYVTHGLLKAVGITAHAPVMLIAMAVALLWCTALSLGRTRSRLIATLFDLRALKPCCKYRPAAA
jgi:hypothetical protein